MQARESGSTVDSGRPHVSVVMPAWNAATTVGAAVSSVLGQTYRSFELVVIDDGSTDATAAIVTSHPGPVRLIHQEHAGPAAARNRGIAEARGELVAFCDADDILFPLHIELLAQKLHRGGDIVTANAWLFYPGGISSGHTRHKGRFPAPAQQRQAILESNFVNIMTLFSRQLHDEIGPFVDGLSGIEDWDFWMRAIYRGCSIIHQPQPTALYRMRTGGLSSKIERSDHAVRLLIARARDHLELSPDERRYVDRRLSGPDPRVLIREGDEALRQGSYRDAAGAYRSAADICPTERALAWKARVMSISPKIAGRLVRARQARRAKRLGIGVKDLR